MVAGTAKAALVFVGLVLITRASCTKPAARHDLELDEADQPTYVGDVAVLNEVNLEKTVTRHPYNVVGAPASSVFRRRRLRVRKLTVLFPKT